MTSNEAHNKEIVEATQLQVTIDMESIQAAVLS